MSSKMIKILSALLLMAAALLVITPSSAANLVQPEEIGDDTANYKTAVVTYVDISSEVSTGASLYFPAEQFVYYEGAEAYLVKERASSGHEITEGTPVYEIKPNVDEVRIEELKRNLTELEKRYTDTVSSRERELRKLRNDHAQAVAAQDVYTAQLLDLDVQAKLVEAEKTDYEYHLSRSRIEEELTELEEELERTEITAPSSGLLSWIQHFTDGSIITPGQHLMTLTDISKLCLRTTNPIPTGQEVTVVVKYRGEEHPIPGKSVVNCSALTSGTMTGSIVEVDLKDISKISDNLLQIDSRAVNLSVVYEDTVLKNVLMVTSDALIKDGNNYFVEILDEENVIHKRPVKVVILKNKFAWVLDGLQDGDTVVLQ